MGGYLHRVSWALLCGALSICAAGRLWAGEQEPLVARTIEVGNELRFISEIEWRFLSGRIDCLGLDAASFGAAKHPEIEVKGRKVWVSHNGHVMPIPFSYPGMIAGIRASDWVPIKVVCGSRGYSVLYSAGFPNDHTLVLSRFDEMWTYVGSDIIRLPKPLHSGSPEKVAGSVIWRLAEVPNGSELIVLNIARNLDRTINPAEQVVRAWNKLIIPRESDTSAGFADRPGPMLSETYLSQVPVRVMPGLTVPQDIERHEVTLEGEYGTARVRVDVGDHPVFLRLRAYVPVEWRISVSSRTRLVAVHLWGPSPQTASGLPDNVAVLRFDNKAGTGNQSQAITLISMQAGSARSAQLIPAYRSNDLVVVDGRRGVKLVERQNIYHPDMSPDLPDNVAARIANCAILEEQDDRIECYRLKALVLRGGGA